MLNDIDRETTAQPTPPTEGATPDAHPGPETFLLDANGRILACSHSAGAWWELDSPEPLIGLGFDELFWLEPKSEEPANDVRGWTIFKIMVGKHLPVIARTVTGDIGLTVQIQKTEGELAELAFSARVQHGPTPKHRSDLADAEPGESSLALAKERFALFELDFCESTARYSPAWWSMLGYREAPKASKPEMLSDMLHPDDSEAMSQRRLRGVANSHRSFSTEARMRRESGEWMWVQFEGSQSFDNAGRLSRISGLMLDIRQRREMEDETLRNEERFLRLTSAGTMAWFEIDFETGETLFSDAFRCDLGLAPGKTGEGAKSFLELLPPEDAQAGLKAFFCNAQANAPGLACRYRLRHEDGRWVECEGVFSLRRNRRGDPVHVCGLQRIAPPGAESGCANSGDTVGAAVESYHHALNAIAECVVIADCNANILHANAQAAELAGKPLRNLIGRPADAVFPLSTRAANNPAGELVSRIAGGGQAVEFDHTYAFAGPNGQEDVVVTCRPLIGPRNRREGAVLILRKLASMPLTPAELVASNRMEALGRLACGIAHDFNNILTILAGGIALSKEKRTWELLLPAEKACDTARDLVRQLLNFARGTTPGRSVCDVRKLIRDAVRMAGAGSTHTIRMELADDLHPVEADTAQIIQVFTNLILNAMQAMAVTGQIGIHAINVPLGEVNSSSLPEGDYVRIEVQDNGSGISPENLNRIFEPFFTTRKDCTGLGLCMVQSIITQHAGTIQAASTIGAGTTFTIYLPRSNKEPVSDSPQNPTVSYGSGQILVMDDDADLCMIAKSMLEMLGYEAETVTEGKQAIASYRKRLEIGRPFTAVILDLTMAGGPGGEDVLKELRGLDEKVCAIVSSGYATEDQAAHYTSLGFAGVLAKPYRSTDLGRTLKEAIAAKA